MKTGIYKIEHLASGKKYIGSAVDFRARWRQHRGLLRAGRHPAVHLQHAWDKYGESAFEFRRLLACSRANLIMYEQRCIDGYRAVDGGFGYNTAPVAGSSLGRTASPATREKIRAWARTAEGQAHLRGRRHTPEAKARASAANKGRKRSAEAIERTAAANRGRKMPPFTEATRAKMRAAKAILSFEKAAEIRALHASGQSSRAIATMYGVSRWTVDGVTHGRRWTAPKSVIREQTL